MAESDVFVALGPANNSAGFQTYSNAIKDGANISGWDNGMQAHADNGTGVIADSLKGIGIFGKSFGNNPGIKGETNSKDMPAIFGFNSSNETDDLNFNTKCYGVLGKSTSGPGVQGVSDKNTGVEGVCIVNANPNPPRLELATAGVKGTNTNQGFGVIGRSEAGIGVLGSSERFDFGAQVGEGVVGRGGRNGVHGWSQSSEGSGVWGENTSEKGGFGVSGSATENGTWGVGCI